MTTTRAARLALISAVALAALPAWAMAQGDEGKSQPDQTRMERFCAAFMHNQDGSWTPRREVQVSTPDGANIISVNSDQVFTPGVIYSGIDVAVVLDKDCLKASGSPP